MLFAHLKGILGITRLRLRGPNGAKDEFLMAATVQNLRKLAMTLPAPALGRRSEDSAGAPRRAAASTSSTASAGSGRWLRKLPSNWLGGMRILSSNYAKKILE
jgi:hypothetical protein